MDYILSLTGSSARAVRDVISNRIWPGPGQGVGQEGVGRETESDHFGSAHDNNPVNFKAGWV